MINRIDIINYHRIQIIIAVRMIDYNANEDELSDSFFTASRKGDSNTEPNEKK